MKKITTLLSAILILFTFSIPANAQNFEGVIYYKLTRWASQQGANELPYMIKGNKARMEVGQRGMEAAMLIIPEESKTVVIMDDAKGYIEMKMDPTTQNNNEDSSEMSVSRTGETKTIAGKECEVWRSVSEQGTYEACMAQGMGTFIMPTGPTQKTQAPKWAQEFIDQGALPLEVIEINNGNRTVQMVATRIEEKSLSDDLFVIPEGYRDMSGMMNQMQNRN